MYLYERRYYIKRTHWLLYNMHRSLLFLCISNFQYLGSDKMIWLSSNVQRMFFFLPIYIWFCKRPVVMRDETCFVQKPPFVTQQCKITKIVCFDNAFPVIVRYFMKIAWNFKSYNYFPRYILIKDLYNTVPRKKKLSFKRAETWPVYTTRCILWF